MYIHHMCVIPRRRRSCGAGILRLVRLHDLEVGFSCLHRQHSCGNIPAHSVFRGMNIVAILLLFNYVDRSWAMGVETNFDSASNPNTSMAPRAHHKLLFKYYGPFLVIERVGDTSYRLQLPPQSRIHPVLHVSQPKKALGPKCQVQAELPPPDTQFAIPLCVLQRCFCQHNSASVPQVLIQWSGQPHTLATWEDLEELKQRFPQAPAWGQATSQGGGLLATLLMKMTHGLHLKQRPSPPDGTRGPRPTTRLKNGSPAL
jgi:hypothetical protein